MFQLLLDPSPSPVASIPTDSGISFLPMIGVVVVLVLLVCIVAVVRRRFQSPDLLNLTPEEVKKRWTEILKTADHGPMGAKLALIEADKLLDHVLKSMMMPGETLGERLKMAAYKYPAITKVWPAHKLRNQLVHDSSFELRPREARRAIDDFHQALRTLRIL